MVGASRKSKMESNSTTQRGETLYRMTRRRRKKREGKRCHWKKTNEKGVLENRANPGEPQEKPAALSKNTQKKGNGLGKKTKVRLAGGRGEVQGREGGPKVGEGKRERGRLWGGGLGAVLEKAAEADNPPHCVPFRGDAGGGGGRNAAA